MSRPSHRIALVGACPFPSPQGSQVFLGQMAERLARAGHEVHLLTYGQGVEQVDRGYRHHRIVRLPGDDSIRSGPNLAKPLLDTLLAGRLVALCRSEGIEIVHAHNYEALAAALAARTLSGVPVVYHSHNLMGDELETYFAPGVLRRLAARAGLLLDEQLPRRADRVIALCEWSARRLVAAGCDRPSPRVIPPAVEDDGPLSPNPRDREALGLDEGDFVVGYCGNLDAYQNLPLLLGAASRLAVGVEAEGRARLRLLLASHHVPPGFARHAAEVGLGDNLRIVLIDGLAEARRALAVSDVVALPRRLGSGYPVKLLNAMSAAKAVVTAGCGSKVLRDGVDGVVVDDDDVEALAGALDRCRRDPARCRQLGERARRRFLEDMTWNVVLPQIEEVYAGLREQASTSGQRES